MKTHWEICLKHKQGLLSFVSNQTGNTTEHNVPSFRCKRGFLLLTGWRVTSESAYSRVQIYLQKCYTHADFLSQVPYCRCWLITKPRLGKGSRPRSQCLFYLGELIDSRDQLNRYLAACVHDSHKQVLSGKVTKCNLSERVIVGRQTLIMAKFVCVSVYMCMCERAEQHFSEAEENSVAGLNKLSDNW